MQNLSPHSAGSPEEPTPPSGSNPPLSDPLVKPERHPPSDPPCHSPSSPSLDPIPTPTHIPSLTSGPTPTPTTRKKRSAFPYIRPPPRVSSGRRQNSSAMSAPQYGNWPSNTVKYEQSDYPSGDPSYTQRRTSDGDQPPYFFAPVSILVRIGGGVTLTPVALPG